MSSRWAEQGPDDLEGVLVGHVEALGLDGPEHHGHGVVVGHDHLGPAAGQVEPSPGRAVRPLVRRWPRVATISARTSS